MECFERVLLETGEVFFPYGIHCISGDVFLSPSDPAKILALNASKAKCRKEQVRIKVFTSHMSCRIFYGESAILSANRANIPGVDHADLRDFSRSR